MTASAALDRHPPDQKGPWIVTNPLARPTAFNPELRQMVLDLYAAAGDFGLSEAMLHQRLIGFQPGTTYLQISQLLSRLRAEGLLSQFGPRGCDRITDTGALAVVTAVPSGWKSQPHPGAKAFYETTGRLAVATAANDKDRHWQLWSADGAHTSLVAGAAGSGVTSVLRGALRALGPSRVTRSWVIDPSGELYADAVLHADRYADSTDEARAMLADVHRVIQDRAQRLTQYRQRWVDPTLLFSLGVLMLTDLPHAVTQWRAELEAIFRSARRTGISVLAGTRNVVASGLPPLTRSALAAGNVLALRTTTHTPASTLLHPVLVKAQSIPKAWPDSSSTVGLGFHHDTLVRTFEVAP